MLSPFAWMRVVDVDDEGSSVDRLFEERCRQEDVHADEVNGLTRQNRHTCCAKEPQGSAGEGAIADERPVSTAIFLNQCHWLATQASTEPASRGGAEAEVRIVR
jgi:hypothetical protein